jgi:dipeptidyl aminopeptidase/acylaminoacyl peptidase
MRDHSFIKVIMLGLLLVSAGSGTWTLAQDADALRNTQVEDYFALKSVGGPRISPDGAWVAYTVRTKDLEKDRSETRLWMVPTAGGKPLPMTAKGSSVWSPRWSPDGKYLTFMASSGDKGSQVFTLDLRGGERVQVTSIEQGVEGYEWSPDGISDRYAGAVSGAGNALWIANYGHDRYQKWYAMELGLPWESREVWEKASPFNKVQNITTPTIFICGEKDWNVPVINSEQMYQAMKRLGRETQLVVYPDAHHGIRRHSYQKDLLERFLGWFDKYVKGPKSDTEKN